MSILGLKIYILVWPIISAAVMALLFVALARDMKAARRDGTDLI